MRKLLLFLLPFIWFADANAQNSALYQHINGKVGISIYYRDTLLNIGSSQLNTTIDNDSRHIIIKLDPTTLNTGIDSLDRQLKKDLQEEVVFDGQMDIEQIQTKGQPPRHFQVEGDLTINGETQHVGLQATLTDYQQGPSTTSMLYLHIDIPLRDFGLDPKRLGMAEYGCVEILQGLMQPTSK